MENVSADSGLQKEVADLKTKRGQLQAELEGMVMKISFDEIM